MIKSYITIAIRNLMRQKLYAFINIFGLALGLACCLLIVQFVKHEWSYDQFHTNKDQLYRLIAHEVDLVGEDNNSLKSLHRLAAVDPMAEFLPGVVNVSGFMDSKVRISSSDHAFYEKIGLANDNFLQMFTFPLAVGDPKTALTQPNSVIITESMVRKFFNQSEPDYSDIIGQPLTFHGRKEQTYTITAVMKDLPNNSSLNFNFLIPISHWNKYGRRTENFGFISIYVQLEKTQDAANVEAVYPDFISTHLAKDQKHFAERDIEYKFTLQSLNDMYWNPITGNAYEKRGNPFAASVMSGIAALVLFLACSNFMTLAIGRSTTRATEVGIRKVMGAQRKQLMQQFWGEAILLSFFALTLGIALTEIFLPIFNGLIQTELDLAYFSDGFFALVVIGLIVSVGLIAGSYPAIVLSRFQPVQTLKGQTRIGGRSNVTRALVVFQYAASIVLIISTSVMINQQHYLRTKDMGFDREHVVVVTIPGNDKGRDQIAERYKQAILKHSQVVSVSITDRSLTYGSANIGFRRPDGSRMNVRVQKIDTDYIEAMGLTLTAGKNIDPDENKTALVNQAFTKKYPDLSLGSIIEKLNINGFKNPTIVGVVKDFHTGPLYETIPPLVLQTVSSLGEPNLMIRIQPDDVFSTLAFLKQTWQKTAPGWEFHQTFFEENLARQYKDELRWQRILTYSASFAIAISCLGLLGLASLAVARRTKEIGIRKVLGASVPNLINLLTKDFIKLLIISNIIAWPIAYYAMDKWLANFAYRIDLGIGIFALAGIIALVIALLVVGIQTFKAARSNPVDALRYE